MNALKTGALALTLIIAVPIMLGFAMASETTSEDYLKETYSVNLTDLVLNSETNYYAPYNGVANNTMLLQVLDSDNNTWSEYAAPDYVTVSSVYTSIPEQTKTNGTLSLSSAVSATLTDLTAESGAIAVGVETTDAQSDVYAYYHDQVKVKIDGSLTKVIYERTDGYTNNLHDTINTYSIIKVADGYNIYDNDGLVYSNAHWIVFHPETETNTYTVTYRDATDVPSTIVSSYVLNNYSSVVYFGDDAHINRYDYLDILGSTAFLDEQMYLNATPVSILLLDHSITSLSYTYGTTVSDSYADPNAGWTIPTPTYTPSVGESVKTYWSNAAVNGSVTFDLAFVGNSTAGFSVYDSINNVTRGYSVINAGGVLSFNDGDSTVTIGTYDYARLKIDLANGLVTISGIKDWVPMGTNPITYNTYTKEILNSNNGESLHGEFSIVGISATNSNVHFRVTTADSVAGQFPSTKNFTFSPISYYPDSEHFTIYFNSVGIYGDSLTVAGQTFTTSPLHKTITVDYDSGNWITQYDGTTITTANAPSVVFNGEWSLTATGKIYESETRDVSSWAAGGFAFDQDDFILCMILTSVGVFVVLGLMKGTKVGILAFVCGAAGIVAYIIA